MRAPRRAGLGLALLAIVAVFAPAAALAATVQDLVILATQTYGLGCAPSATDQTCDGPLGTTRFVAHAVIKPASGEEMSLLTRASLGEVVPASGLDATGRKWMRDMQSLACGDPPKVASFIDSVGVLTKTGTVPTEIIGACRFDGRMVEHQLAAGGDWIVQSVVLPPPTPGPTPTATPKPTAKPTSTPAPTATIAPSGSPSAAPTESVAVSASPPAVAPSATPAGSGPVSPAEASPSPGSSGQPGSSAGAVASPPTPPATQPPTFSESVLGIEDVNSDGGAVGGSLLLALLMLLIIGFAGELFNNTVENNYDTVSGWMKKGPLGWLSRVAGWFGRRAGFGLLTFIALTALISSFVDPNFTLDMRSLAEFLGFLIGLIVVLASFKLPPMLAHRRKTGELGHLRPLPWALVIAALFVLVSRIGGLQPGYLYAIILGAIFVKEVSDSEEGRETFYGSIWTLIAAVVAWLGLTWARGLGYDPNGFGITFLSTAFAAILVSGLEATAFGLMPLRFMPGYAVYKFNRLAWALLFGLSVFAFFHILIGPSSGYVSSLSPQAWTAALGVFAVFGGLSIATWLYFRLRPAPLDALEGSLER